MCSSSILPSPFSTRSKRQPHNNNNYDKEYRIFSIFFSSRKRNKDDIETSLKE